MCTKYTKALKIVSSEPTTRRILRATDAGVLAFTVPAVPPPLCRARPLVRLPWRYNDAGRRSGHSPCASRAIAIATGLPMDAIELELATAHRVRFGADPDPTMGYRMDVIGVVLLSHGFKHHHVRHNNEPCAMHVHEVPHNSVVALTEHMTVLDATGALQDKLDPTDDAFGVPVCVRAYWRPQ